MNVMSETGPIKTMDTFITLPTRKHGNTGSAVPGCTESKRASVAKSGKTPSLGVAAPLYRGWREESGEIPRGTAFDGKEQKPMFELSKITGA
jgi:hypothetical protein